MSVLLQDNFTGTTIDTSKWTETDPNSFISQNNNLIFTLPHSTNTSELANKLESVASITSGVAVAQANITWTTDTLTESMAGMYLWKDNNNFAYIGSRSTGGTYRLRIFYGGSQVYTNESSIAKGKDVKVWTDGTSIKFYYWSGSAWTQIGTTQTYSLGYNLKMVLSCQDNTAFSGANPVNIDDAYLSDQDYTTQYPAPTTNIKSINGLVYASIKSRNGLAMSSIKNINGLA